MAESTLSLDYQGYLTEVGQFLGYGRDPTTFNSAQLAEVRACIRGGERQSYDPPKHPQEQNPHSWSFLRPTRNLHTVSGRSDYDLPDDYGAMLGNLTVLTTTGWYWPIQISGEGTIRETRSRGLSSATGRIQMAAIRAKMFQPGVPQRFEILFWPTPDSAYTIEYKCLVNPIGMSDENPWPYGGMHFTQTLLEGCLAEAELQLDGVYGVHRQEFLARIQAAAQVDKQQARPEFIGMQNDPSTPEGRRVFGGRLAAFPDTITTYNGVQY